MKAFGNPKCRLCQPLPLTFLAGATCRQCVLITIITVSTQSTEHVVNVVGQIECNRVTNSSIVYRLWMRPKSQPARLLLTCHACVRLLFDDVLPTPRTDLRRGNAESTELMMTGIEFHSLMEEAFAKVTVERGQGGDHRPKT